MKTIRLWAALSLQGLKALFRRGPRTVLLLVLCAALPLGAGPAAAALLQGGVSFSGIHLALTAPEGDNTPATLMQFIGGMKDVSRYCTFEVMEEDEARQALRDGSVSAILTLPENFLQGIMDGSNPAVRLTVPQDKPLESLLTYWVGQSATDLLSAAQAAVYAVLDLYRETEFTELSWNTVLLDINMKCIQWVLNRDGTFQEVRVSAAGTLPVSLHYSLSILGYLGLAAAPLFFDLYTPSRLQARRRLRAVGWKSGICCVSDLTASSLILYLILAAGLGAITRSPKALLYAMPMALLCALFAALCCLLCKGAAGSGGTAFVFALVFLGLAGGILPPALLPTTIRNISWLSPISWMRAFAAGCAGYPMETRTLVATGVSIALLFVLCQLLYAHRVSEQEVAA